MTRFAGPIALAAAGLPGPAVLCVAAICAVRFVRGFGVGPFIYVAAFLTLGYLVG